MRARRPLIRGNAWMYLFRLYRRTDWRRVVGGGGGPPGGASGKRFAWA